MANQWFRMYSEFAHDPKVQMMSETLQRRFVMLLCLRCNANETFHETMTDEIIAFQLRISDDEWKSTKQVFISKNMLTDDNDIVSWDKRQNSEFSRPSSEAWRLIRSGVFERDNYTCQYCGIRGVKLECDHVVPVSRGGSSDETNLVTACFACNRSKHSKTLEEWRSF